MTDLTDNYSELLRECIEIKKAISRTNEQLITLYWKLGVKFVTYEQDGRLDVQYSDETIRKLATDLGIHETTLYRIRQFALRCPTEEKLSAAKQRILDCGRNFTWSEIRRSVLPAEKDKPELYGGKAAVVDRTMSRVESLARETEELSQLLHDTSLSVDQREQIIGVVNQALGVMAESAKEVECLPALEVDRMAYLDHIRSLPCVICEVEPSEPNHLETGGVGMKGSDYVTLPMCRRHHNLYHSLGKNTFSEEFGIDLFREVTRILVAWLE